IQQFEEIRLNPDLQPCYIQFYATNQPTPMYPSRSDARDGWYIIDALEIDPESYNQKGAAEGRMTVTRVAPSSPSSLAIRYDGAALSAPSFSQASIANPMLGLPVASTGNFGPSRPGAEGSIPITLPINFTPNPPNPVPFVRPGTVAALFTGGVRVWDTIIP